MFFCFLFVGGSDPGGRAGDLRGGAVRAGRAHAAVRGCCIRRSDERSFERPLVLPRGLPRDSVQPADGVGRQQRSFRHAAVGGLQALHEVAVLVRPCIIAAVVVGCRVEITPSSRRHRWNMSRRWRGAPEL